MNISKIVDAGLRVAERRLSNFRTFDRPMIDHLDERRNIWSRYVVFGLKTIVPEWSTRGSEATVAEDEMT
jgi:hypothetical protein